MTAAASRVICEETEVPGVGGPRLFVRVYHPAPGEPLRGSVLFLHGYDDHSGRYADTAAMLADAGYRVRTFDFRGHGRSDGKRGFCARWTEYLDDLAAVRAADDAGEAGGKPFLVAQSHGCLVALHWTLRFPGTVAGLVLCSPYLRLVMPVPRAKIAAARALNRLAPSMRMKSEIRVDYLTRDPELQQETFADRTLSRVATPRWFCASTQAQAEILRRADEIRTPTLILHGTADRIADLKAARELYEKLGSPDKTFKPYDAMRHETLREVDREQVWSDIVAWLNARAGA
jgi:alpha-beta hydrolase superfamily lysophospholipase